jgi:lipopolysaccharide export system permease protein
MNKLDFYIIRKFLGTFFLSLGLLIVIVIVFDVSENIGDFIEKKAPLQAIIFDYYLRFIPYFANLFSYLFVFIAVIFFTSKMAGNSEIIAMLSSGISFRRLLVPYLVVAVLLGIGSYVMGNYVIPVTDKQRVAFKTRYIRNKFVSKDKNIHLQIEPNVFIFVKSFSASRNEADRFSIEQYEDQRLIYKLNSKRAIWDSTTQSWKIKQYFERRLIDGEEHFKVGNEKDTSINLSLADFIHHKDEIDQMTLPELNKQIESETLKGSKRVTKLEIEREKRRAFPVATIIMTLIGVSISSRKIRGGMGLHLGMGLAMAFSYIFFMQISNVFATNGDMSPVIAVWIPNLIFGVMALLLVRFAQK